MNSNPSRMSLTRHFSLADQSVGMQTLWIVFFSALTAIGAQVEIPNYPVPFTLQTMFVLLAGALLGPRNGALSQILYLVAGLLGAPVFSGAGFGIVKLVGVTGGYLASFPVAAALVGYLVQRQEGLVWTFISMGLGLVVIFSCGTLHLYTYHIHNFSAAFTSGFMIFSWWDILKLGAAAMTYHEIAKRWPRVPR